MQTNLSAQNVHSGFVAGTLVWTEKGLVAIETIKPGDKVLSKLNASDAPVYQPVSCIFSSSQEVIFVSLTSSKKLEDDKDETIEDFFFTTATLPVQAANKGWVTVVESNASWEERNLARRNETTCFIGDAYPVYEVPGEPNAGTLIFNHSEEFCFLVRFNGTSPYFPDLEDIGQRFNGVEPDYPDGDLTVSELYADQPDPADYKNFRATIFGIKVEGFHTYFVGELGLWVRDN